MAQPTSTNSGWDNYKRLTGAASRVAQIRERASRGPGFYAHRALTEEQDRLRDLSQRGIRDSSSVARQAARETTASTSWAAAEAFRTRDLDAQSLTREWRVGSPGAGVTLGLLGAGAVAPVQARQEALLKRTLDRAKVGVRMNATGWPGSSMGLGLRCNERSELERIDRELQAARHLAPTSHLHSQLGALSKQVSTALQADRTARREAARLASFQRTANAVAPWYVGLGAYSADVRSRSPGLAAHALPSWRSGTGTYQTSVLDQTSRRVLRHYLSSSPLTQLRDNPARRAAWADPLGDLLDQQRRALQRSQTDLCRVTREAFRQGLWTPDQPLEGSIPAQPEADEDQALEAVIAAIVWAEALRRFDSAQERGRVWIAQTGDVLREVGGRGVRDVGEVAWAVRARRELMPLLALEERVALSDKERNVALTMCAALCSSVVVRLSPSPATYLGAAMAHSFAWGALRSLYCHLGLLAAAHDREDLVPERHRS